MRTGLPRTKLFSYFICAGICSVILMVLHGEIHDEKFWKNYHISGSIAIGICCSTITSLLMWRVHDIYLAIRLYKYGHLVNAKIINKRSESSSTYSNQTGGNVTTTSYYIKYTFIDDQTVPLTHKLVYNYCQHYLPTELIDLCKDFLGYNSFRIIYEEQPMEEQINQYEFSKCPNRGCSMLMKYDPKYPKNRMISDTEIRYFVRDIVLFVITLFGFASFICILFEFFFKNHVDGFSGDAILISIGLILLCVMVISLVFMIIICACNKTFCFAPKIGSNFSVTNNYDPMMEILDEYNDDPMVEILDEYDVNDTDNIYHDDDILCLKQRSLTQNIPQGFEMENIGSVHMYTEINRDIV